MVLNAEKRNKLIELVVRHKATLADAGTSAPASTPAAAASAPNSSEPSPVDDRLKGVVVAIGSEDKDTYTGLVFKRPRVGDVEAPSNSTSDGHAPFFKDNSPNASSPCNLIMHEGGRENAPEGGQVPPTAELPAILQQALRCFQNKEVVESLGEDLL